MTTFLLAALLAGGYLVFWSPSPPRDDARGQPSPTRDRATATPTPTPTPTEEPPVLSLPGDFPTAGPGTFRYAGGEGEVLGGSGTLWRFRLAVEDTVDQDPDELAAFVDETLSGQEGWTAGGELRFQRVPADAPHDITIHLATRDTTVDLCSQGGVNVVGGNLPDGGVSCHAGSGNVVLNLNRWRQSVPHFVGEQVPLETYRQMLLNHEVGHALGLNHEACPGAGEPAPVMQTQTISLDGCEAYAWPHLAGQRYRGPPA